MNSKEGIFLISASWIQDKFLTLFMFIYFIYFSFCNIISIIMGCTGDQHPWPVSVGTTLQTTAIKEQITNAKETNNNRKT